MLHYKNLQFCLRLGGKAFHKLMNNVVYWVNEWKKWEKGGKWKRVYVRLVKKQKRIFENDLVAIHKI